MDVWKHWGSAVAVSVVVSCLLHDFRFLSLFHLALRFFFNKVIPELDIFILETKLVSGFLGCPGLWRLFPSEIYLKK